MSPTVLFQLLFNYIYSIFNKKFSVLARVKLLLILLAFNFEWNSSFRHCHQSVETLDKAKAIVKVQPQSIAAVRETSEYMNNPTLINGEDCSL